MAAAVSWPLSPLFNDADTFNATRKAVLLWSTQDFQNSNWWWDIISVPQTYSCAYLMMAAAPQTYDFPSAFEQSKGLEIMFRAAWWNASLGEL